MCGSGDGFGGKVQLRVVGITVEVNAMAAQDMSKGEDVQYEEEGAKHRALGDTVCNKGCDGFAIVYGNELMSVREVGGEPGEGSASDTEGGFES